MAKVVTYGCEGWSIRKANELGIEAFEVKDLRQVLRVSWRARKANERVLEKGRTK